MLLPISDDDRGLSGPAYVTITILLLNLFVFFFLQGAGQNTDFTYGWSVIPYEIMTGADLTGMESVQVNGIPYEIPQREGPHPVYWTILSAMFMHGGFMHLFGNMLYLWIFGDNVEHRFGSGPFLFFYLASGVVATFVQVFLEPGSVVPNLGASGAISGVLGAYLVLFPRNRVYAFFFFTIVSIPAVLAIGVWFFLQVIDGWGAIMLSEATVGGIAYGAHIGGFVAGVVMALILRKLIKEERPHVFSRHASLQSRRYW